jgi:predicted outer membrane protein
MKTLFFLILATTFLAASVSAATRAKPQRHPLLPPIPPPTDAAQAKLYNTTLGGKDLRLLTDALEYGLQQVFLATLAGGHAEADRVKALASVLSQTQREENSKLARLAALKDVNFSSREAAAQEGLTRKFAKLSGEKFDSAWTEEIVRLNLRAVSNYSEGVASTDPDIKAFSEKALPLAKEKLALVSGGGAPAKVPGFRTQMSQPQPR